ncbi:MAG: tetratricopeptide repeat protein [Phycisphaerales bacterium JB063]
MPTTDPPASTPPPADPTWVQLKDAVADAMDLEPDAWPEALSKALDGNTELIEQATAMLRAASGSTAQLHPDLDQYVGNDGPDPYALVNKDIGGYTVERLIAEGGMGAVYAAKQFRPERTVALKVLRPGSVADSTRMRFGREVTALGRLKHPNIAQIYDAGVYRPVEGSKLPYLVMEYVDGTSLTDYARHHAEHLDDKLGLMIKVADAVHAAHQQAIIHRDLKPANILVDREGEPKVLDFGIARLADENSVDFTSHTATGAILGTLAYMSPEQVTGNASAADARADVYAMGVMLYEIVMGKPPVDVKHQPLPVALQRIAEERTIHLGVGFDSDLQTIIATAMEHDPARRYGSASEFAADLRRYLSNDPIAARPPTTRYLLTKFAQRHRGPLAAAIAFVLLLIGATVLASVGFLRAESQRKDAVAARDEAQRQRQIADDATDDAVTQRNLARDRELEAESARAETAIERDRALEEQQRAQAINQFMQNMLGAADPEILGKSVTLLDTIDYYIDRVDTTFAGQPVTRAEIYSTLGWVYFSLGEYNKALPILESSIALYEKTIGPNDQRTLVAVGHLASVYDERGDFDDLEILLDERLQPAIETLGKSNDNVLHMQMMRASLLNHQGRFAEADALFEQTLDSARDALGPTNELTLTFMNNYGGFLIEQGDYARAQPLLSAVVKYRMSDPAASIQDLAVSMSNLAATYESQGRYDEAHEIYADATQALIEALGESHTTTISLMMAHVTALQSLGRSEEATNLSRRVVELRREHFGPDHIDTLLAMNNHAVQLNYAKHYDEAVRVAQQAYEGLLAQLGSAHPNVWQAEQNYAVSLSNVDRNAEAEPLLELGLERLQVSLGRSHPQTLVQANNLAMCLHELDRNDEALAMLEECIELGADTLPDPYFAVFHRNAGRCAMGIEQFERSEQHLLTSFELLRDEPGGAGRARTAMFLAQLYQAWGKPDLESQFEALSTPDN